MGRVNINKMSFDKTSVDSNRVKELIVKPLVNGFIPTPIDYKDFDEQILEFTKKDLDISFNGENIKSFYFAQQRLSEFTKTWEMVDENQNVLPNFKIVTRDNDPKKGTLMGNYSNIPGDHFWNIGSFEKNVDGNNIVVNYKIKQPFCVDLMYNLKFVCNKLNLLNKFNEIVIEKFKNKQYYLLVNGHYMPMVLEEISDESDYDLDERKIFVQTFKIKVMGYIIRESDIVVDESPTKKLTWFDYSIKKNMFVKGDGKDIYVEFPRKSRLIKTIKSNDNYTVSSIMSENIQSYEVFVNDSKVDGSFELKKHDTVLIKIEKINYGIEAKITFKSE